MAQKNTFFIIPAQDKDLVITTGGAGLVIYWLECWAADPYGSRYTKMLNVNFKSTTQAKYRQQLKSLGLFSFQTRKENGISELWISNLHGSRVKNFGFPTKAILDDTEVNLDNIELTLKVNLDNTKANLDNTKANLDIIEATKLESKTQSQVNAASVSFHNLLKKNTTAIGGAAAFSGQQDESGSSPSSLENAKLLEEESGEEAVRENTVPNSSVPTKPSSTPPRKDAEPLEEESRVPATEEATSSLNGHSDTNPCSPSLPEVTEPKSDRKLPETTEPKSSPISFRSPAPVKRVDILPLTASLSSYSPGVDDQSRGENDSHFQMKYKVKLLEDAKIQVDESLRLLLGEHSMEDVESAVNRTRRDYAAGKIRESLGGWFRECLKGKWWKNSAAAKQYEDNPVADERKKLFLEWKDIATSLKTRIIAATEYDPKTDQYWVHVGNGEKPPILFEEALKLYPLDEIKKMEKK